MTRMPRTRSALASLLFAIFLSSCSSFTPTAPSGSTATVPLDEVNNDQPSLPGGVVVMENDPHCEVQWAGEAEATRVCRDEAKGTSQIRLTGKLALTAAERKCVSGVVSLRVLNQIENPEALRTMLGEDDAFEYFLELHDPMNLKFSAAATREGMFVASRRLASDIGAIPMVPCQGTDCDLGITWSNVSMDLRIPEEEVAACPSSTEPSPAVYRVIRPEEPASDVAPAVDGAPTVYQLMPPPESQPAVYHLAPPPEPIEAVIPGVLQLAR